MTEYYEIDSSKSAHFHCGVLRTQLGIGDGVRMQEITSPYSPWGRMVPLLGIQVSVSEYIGASSKSTIRKVMAKDSKIDLTKLKAKIEELRPLAEQAKQREQEVDVHREVARQLREELGIVAPNRLASLSTSPGGASGFRLELQLETVQQVRAVMAHKELLEACKTLLAQYVELVNSGDCGFWNPEEEPEVIGARAAIAKGEK